MEKKLSQNLVKLSFLQMNRLPLSNRKSTFFHTLKQNQFRAPTLAECELQKEKTKFIKNVDDLLSI